MSRIILTSLMKEKFGVTRSSSLKITEKDTLYTTFRKLADYIYKNGDWTEEDQLAAVETMVRNRERLAVGIIEDNNQKVTVSRCTQEECEELGNLIQSYIPYTAKITRKLKDGGIREEIRYVLLDEQNKVGTKHNKYYWLQGTNNQPIKKTYGFGNVNRAIGYDRIIRNLVETFQQQEGKLNELGVTMIDIQRFLHNVTSSEYSGKKWQYLFTKTFLGDLTEKELNTFERDESPRYWGIPPELAGEDEKNIPSFRWRNLSADPNSRNKLNLDQSPYLIPSPYGSMYSVPPKTIEKQQQYNRVLQFIQDYLEDSYDLILQQEYEKSIDKMTRASAWQTKKQINQETKEIMQETTLNRYFGIVELDNDVDLELFYKFEVEMAEIFEVLPQSESIPDLRLRKLGNYHALGLYHCVSNTIAIDFRGPEDKNKSNYVPNQNGIRSFIHEYGHFLDYTFRNDSELLSMQPEFKKIVGQYRENIQHLSSDSPIRRKLEYYSTPTEVFARAFELYSLEQQFETSFINSKEAYIAEEYQCFDKELTESLTLYFDQVFPEYKEKIRKYQTIQFESIEETEMEI